MRWCCCGCLHVENHSYTPLGERRRLPLPSAVVTGCGEPLLPVVVSLENRLSVCLLFRRTNRPLKEGPACKTERSATYIEGRVQ